MAKRERRLLTLLPEGWMPKIEVGIKMGLTDSQTRREVDRFLGYARSKAAKYADWDAAWRNWIDRACEYQGVKPASYYEVAIGTPKIVFLRREDPRFEEWLRFKNRKSFPLNRDGGWYFPSEHPPSTAVVGIRQMVDTGADESDEPFL